MPLMSSLAVCVAMSTSQRGGAAGSEEHGARAGGGSGGGLGGGVGALGTSARCLAGTSWARYTRTDATNGSAKLICFGCDGSFSGERAEIVIQSPFGWIDPEIVKSIYVIAFVKYTVIQN